MNERASARFQWRMQTRGEKRQPKTRRSRVTNDIAIALLLTQIHRKFEDDDEKMR